MSGSEDKTEAASSRRLERARAEGNVPLSREATAFAVLASAACVAMFAAPGLSFSIVGRMAAFLAQPDRIDPATAIPAAAAMTLRASAPFALAALVAGAASVLLQTGFLINASALQPDITRLDPRRGLKRIVSVNALIETGKSVLKLGLVGWAAWHVLGGMLPQLAASLAWAPGRVMSTAWTQLIRLLVAILAAQMAIAGFDLVRVRLQHARSLRMSRQDLREEHRDTEGDPHIKGRLKQLRLQRARRRMLAAVPKATVVVTNPTHYAIALSYDRGRAAAPRVVAKGVDTMAARIREVAEQNRVPLVASPALARALFRVELDTEIPAEHYQAVAEIIAYVWRLKTRVQGRRP